MGRFGRCEKFLVLDEADRMIEVGHFAELDNILRLTLRDSRFISTFLPWNVMLIMI
jgi:superfamily II DNA/RNA helicase